MPGSLRLIDLHTDWLLQYTPETTVYDPSLYEGVSARLPQAEGYLQGTRAAILSCYRRADDWAKQADPWAALAALITRIEAEFPGRLLADRDDYIRFLDDPDGLCWGVIGIEGFDALVRSPADLERLPQLFRRGVRLFQPSYMPSGGLAGCSQPGDDRGLTDLGRAFLEALADIGSVPEAPRPILDLAHLNPRSISEVLDWFEADEARPGRLLPAYSHGTPWHEGFDSPRAITLDSLRRLRALGGCIGMGVSPPFFQSRDQVKAAIEQAASLPFLGQPGYEGIAIGTDFLGVDQVLDGLGDVPAILAWLEASFPAEVAALLIEGNARKLLTDMLRV